MNAKLTTQVTENAKFVTAIRRAGITLRSEEARAFEIASRGLPLNTPEEAALRRAAERAASLAA